MIRIAISQAAFEAIVRTLPFGSMSFENKIDERGDRTARFGWSAVGSTGCGAIAGPARAIATSSAGCGGRSLKRASSFVRSGAGCFSRRIMPPVPTGRWHGTGGTRTRGWPMQPARGLSGHDPGRDHPDAVAFHDMARRARPLADRRFGAPIDRRRGRPRACRVSRRGQLNGKGRPKAAFK
jgi:hypothetical protein